MSRRFNRRWVLWTLSLLVVSYWAQRFWPWKIKKTSNTSLKDQEKPMIKQRFSLDFQWPTQEPFLFCVHHFDFYPKGTQNFGPESQHLRNRNLGEDFQAKDGFRMYHGETVPGFPVHPHRGFETITIVRKGYVDHADSLGAAGRYGQGDVQWMTAGRGVQHSEMFPLLHQDQENTSELFQIWLNLPKKSKMAPAHFKMLWSEDIPHVMSQDQKVNITVIAGTYKGAQPPTPPPDSWASDPNSDTQIWLVKMSAESKFQIPACTQGTSRSLYVFEGQGITLNQTKLPVKTGIFVDEGPLELESPSEGTEFLFLQSRPIGEPVVQYGPFVMNSENEIRQTIQDYQTTEFGGWPWERYDMVHGGQIERFAKHPDGRIEKRKAHQKV